VFHAHYVVEQGFYGGLTGFRPYVVSAWGSDVFVESYKPLGQLVARLALRRAGLVTANDPAMAQRLRELGVREPRLALVRLGVDPLFLEGPPSINVAESDEGPPVIFSDRALEPLYHVDVVIRGVASLLRRVPDVRLVVAHEGRERGRLGALVRELGVQDAVEFVGRLDPLALRHSLAKAHIYVSVPASDSLAQSTMEAMAVGAFPVVGELPSQDWILHGVTGLRVRPGDPEALADSFYEALSDPEMRRRAAALNRERIEADGMLEKNMLAMERHYYRLAVRPVRESDPSRGQESPG
jgi:glycosyltransferase involved in cell wall biosynthesis